MFGTYLVFASSMQKLAAYFLLIVHLGFYMQPFSGRIVSKINHIRWEYAQEKHVGDLNHRVSLLSELGKVAEHHQKEKQSTQHQETLNITATAFLLPSFINISTAFSEVSNHSSFYLLKSGVDCTRIFSPPPKVS